MTDRSIFTLITRLWSHLTRRRRVQLALLLALMILCALSEVISLGAVLPFIGILTSPERVFNHPLIHRIALQFGITDSSHLVLPITIVFAVAAVLAGGIRLIMLWVSTRLANAIGTDLSIEVYRRTLYQPYRVHVSRNSSEVISGIMSKTWGVVGVIQSFLTTISSLIIAVSITLALFSIDPLVLSIAASVFGISYGLITWLCRKRLKSNSESISRENTQIIKALQEGLGGIRDILLNGSQSLYCKTYRRADLTLRRSYASNIFIASGPRFAMEAVGMVMIAVLAYGMSIKWGGIGVGLPILATLALGAQRLLPVIQLVYSNWATVMGNRTSLIDALCLLDQPLPAHATQPEPEPLQFKNSITLKNVRFRYLEDGPWILNGIDLTISKGCRIGFVGSTGGGKSTLLDVVMGLLDPTEGVILIDGKPLNEDTRRAWQRCIAHVPQSIFLSDTTIAENIAFGIPKDKIDMQKVRNTAYQAQIAHFIESQGKSYNSLVGERGIRLSGGQRQRIGIARALYRDASVLIFDEATSSLDNLTELAVMESINLLNRDLTILLVAHRLTTVKPCDIIVEIENGRVVAQGAYNELLKISPGFRKMACALA